jgi:hypothetical protein
MIQTTRKLRSGVNALTAMVILSISCPASAWVQVIHKGGSQFHWDNASVHRQGEFLSVVTMTNFDEPYKRNERGIHYLKQSMSASVLLDCINMRFKTLDTVWFDEAWGKGMGHRFNAVAPQWFGPEWKYYALNMNTLLFKHVCK